MTNVDVLRAAAREFQELFTERRNLGIYQGRPAQLNQDRAELARRYRAIEDAETNERNSGSDSA